MAALIGGMYRLATWKGRQRHTRRCLQSRRLVFSGVSMSKITSDEIALGTPPKIESTSPWFALRNRVFLRIWLATVFSGIFVSAQDVTATWLMHDLGASYLLSLMATAASTPLFLFTLPAGVVADMVSRRAVLLAAVTWQGACSAALALGAWTHAIGVSFVLACIFAFGIGVAFTNSVWGASVPDIVSKEQLPSAITLGGVQLNVAGIAGPALGGFLLSLLGAPLLISINVLAFLLVALAVLRWKPRPVPPGNQNENFRESFVRSFRYANSSPRFKIILFRNLMFSLVISVIPAMLPVIALGELKCSAAQLGLFFTCVAIGSLAGAVIVLPYLRQRLSPNAIASIAMGMAAVVLLAMALGRNPPALMIMVAFGGVAWAMAASEFWVAGQRVVPAWVRGRLNAFLIMIGQGGIALGSVVLGTGAAHAGLDLTLTAAAVLAFIGLGVGGRLSINFDSKDSVDAAPLNPLRCQSYSRGKWTANPPGTGRICLSDPGFSRKER
jgi:predicted MFS family arabinose efflux permease